MEIWLGLILFLPRSPRLYISALAQALSRRALPGVSPDDETRKGMPVPVRPGGKNVGVSRGARQTPALQVRGSSQLVALGVDQWRYQDEL